MTATPIATSRPTTILAASGLSGAGPDGCECECECATRNRVEVPPGVFRWAGAKRPGSVPVGRSEATGECSGGLTLLAVGRQEVAQPLDGVGQVAGPGQRHDPQVVGRGPVEPRALGHQDLLLKQQVEHELLVIVNVVDL